MIFEIVVLLLFCVFLLSCVVLNLSVLYALGAGYILFFIYCRKKGYTVKEIIIMNLDGIRLVKNIMITFVLIGALTALWRASGTIPSIVSYAGKLFSPGIFVLLTFILNCLISFLTGTSFGTSATMGTICMTMAAAMNLSPAVVGGAALSGAFFGDRCSPVSTSAILVSKVTGTESYTNLKLMFKSALIPFFITCLVFFILGTVIPAEGAVLPDVESMFSKEFNIGLLMLIPAAVIIIMSIFRLNVKITLSVSILAAVVLCFTCQQQNVLDVIKAIFLGYEARLPELQPIISGGGVVSMIKMMCIVTLSSSFSGIFKETRLIMPVKGIVDRLSDHMSKFAVTLIVSIVTVSIACNQTLGIMLTSQLCSDVVGEKQKMAIYIEDTAVLISALIPWSIAGAIPLAMINAPVTALLFAVYLYIVPVFNLIIESVKEKKMKKA